jgi:hypothetical protein
MFIPSALSKHDHDAIWEGSLFSGKNGVTCLFETILRIAPQSFVVKTHHHLVTELEEADRPT